MNMKKLQALVFLLCMALLPILQSCDDDGYSIGDFTPPLWATVRVTGNAFYLDCDVWGTLWPVNTDLGHYHPVDGQRVITVFNPLSDAFGGYDHAVKILQIREVLTKEVETLTAENEAEFGNDSVLIYQGDISISNGYMNIIFMQNLPSKTKHRISLVRSQEDIDASAEDGYLHLQLRYNDYDDITGYARPGVVSFNLNGLETPENPKGIKLKLNSIKNGEVEITFQLENSDSDSGTANMEILEKFDAMETMLQ